MGYYQPWRRDGLEQWAEAGAFAAGLFGGKGKKKGPNMAARAEDHQRFITAVSQFATGLTDAEWTGLQSAIGNGWGSVDIVPQACAFIKSLPKEAFDSFVPGFLTLSPAGIFHKKGGQPTLTRMQECVRGFQPVPGPRIFQPVPGPMLSVAALSVPPSYAPRPYYAAPTPALEPPSYYGAPTSAPAPTIVTVPSGGYQIAPTPAPAQDNTWLWVIGGVAGLALFATMMQPERRR